MRKPLLIALVLVMVASAVFVIFRDDKKTVRYRTENAALRDIVETVTATGTLNAVTTVLVGTQVSGTIRNLYADYNSRVARGQLIAQIDPAPFEAQVEQAKANRLAALADVERSKAALLDAKRTMERSRELFSRGLIARSEFETSETSHDSASAQVDAARARVAQSEAALRLAETNLRYTRIVSPVNGIVISRNVDTGQTVAASFQTPTLFTIAEDLGKMQIDTNVDEADIGKIREGQEVEFTVDTYPELLFRGIVSQIRSAPIVVQNVVTYDVVVKVENPELSLKPGMTANVSIIISRKSSVLSIPNSALRFRPPPELTAGGEAKGYGIWILAQNTPKRVAVSAGISDGIYTEILSGEVREGQEVIVESLQKTGKVEKTPPPRFFR